MAFDLNKIQNNLPATDLSKLVEPVVNTEEFENFVQKELEFCSERGQRVSQICLHWNHLTDTLNFEAYSLNNEDLYVGTFDKWAVKTMKGVQNALNCVVDKLKSLGLRSWIGQDCDKGDELYSYWNTNHIAAVENINLYIMVEIPNQD